MSKAQVEAAFGRTVIEVHSADQIDESGESPQLLAREASVSLFEEFDEEPGDVYEMHDGFAIASPGHAIFMGHGGAFEIADLPASGETFDDDDDDDDDTNEGDTEEYVLVQMETGVVISDACSLTAEDATEKSEAFEAEGLSLCYVLEDETEDGKLKPESTLDGLQERVEEILDGADFAQEKLMEALRIFDDAKAEGNYDEALVAANAIAEAVGKSLPAPKKPVDVGPGPGKSTGAGGKGSPRVGVPTKAAPKPKKPLDVGPGPGKNTGESVDERKKAAGGKWRGARVIFKSQADAKKFKEAILDDYEGGVSDIHPPTKQKDGTWNVDFRAVDMVIRKLKVGAREYRGEFKGLFKSRKPHDAGGVGEVVVTLPATRIEEFIEVAQKAGAGDSAEVVKTGDSYEVTLDESVASAVKMFFKGDEVTYETVEDDEDDSDAE